MRRLRFASSEDDAPPRFAELELYRIFDVAAGWYHAVQTASAVAGRLVFVRQGKHGALSLMLVGGRRAGCGIADEFSILVRVRACA